MNHTPTPAQAYARVYQRLTRENGGNNQRAHRLGCMASLRTLHKNGQAAQAALKLARGE